MMRKRRPNKNSEPMQKHEHAVIMLTLCNRLKPKAIAAKLGTEVRVVSSSLARLWLNLRKFRMLAETCQSEDELLALYRQPKKTVVGDMGLVHVVKKYIEEKGLFNVRL